MNRSRPTHSEIDWLVLDLNSFFASCEQQADPRLRGRPIGVVPMLDVDTTCLLAASKEAKMGFGLYTGTSVREAKEKCPDIVLIQASHKKYTQYHDKILEAVETCTPVDKVLSIDEVACKMTGSQRNPDNAMALAHKIKKTIREQVGEYLTSSIGLAPNILLAKLASDMEKPDGLVLIRPCDLPDKILHLSPRAFSGIGPKMEERLKAGGLHSMIDLYNCERKKMRQIWGSVEGERFYDRIWGENSNRADPKKTVIGHQHVLEPHLRNKTKSYDVLHHLLIKAVERLRHINYYCKSLSVHVKLTNRQGYWEDAMDFTETQDTQFLLHRLQQMWHEFPVNARPLRVGIMLHGLVEAKSHQFDLFEKKKPTQLYTAIDGINAKFGRHTVSFGLNPYVQEKVGKDKIAFQHVPKDIYT